MNEQTSVNVKKITLHYAAAFALYYAAFCMVRSFISVYLLSRGFSYTQAGIIAGIHMFATAVIQPNYSGILNRFSRLGLHRFLAICCFPPLICSVLTFLLPSNILLFILLYIVFGVCQIGLQSLMVSVGMEYVNAGIPINAGLGRGVGSLGYAAANLLLGMLIVRFGIPVSHKLNILLLLLLALAIITLPDPGGEQAEEETGEKKGRELSDPLISFLKSSPVFALFALSAVFIFFGHSVLNTYMPNIAGQFGLGSDFIGAINGFAASLELLPMMLYTRFSKKFSPSRLLCIAAVFFSVKILLAALAKDAAGLVISQSMQIFAYALYSISSIYFTNQAVRPKNRILAQGLMVGAGEAGYMIGGLTGGIILDHLTIRVLLWIAVSVTIIGSFMMVIAVTRFRKAENRSTAG